MSDRMADGYEPDFDIDREVGSQGELFTWKVVEALKDGSSEVKNDMEALFTGNIYIECQCLRRGHWRPSGIVTTTTEVWCHVIGSGLLIAAPTADVRTVVLKRWRTPDEANTSCPRGSHPTRGVLISVPQFVQEIRSLVRLRYNALRSLALTCLESGIMMCPWPPNRRSGPGLSALASASAGRSAS